MTGHSSENLLINIYGNLMSIEVFWLLFCLKRLVFLPQAYASYGVLSWNWRADSGVLVLKSSVGKF